MKRTWLALAFLLPVTATLAEQSPTSVDASALVGIWEGNLSVPPGLELQMIFKIARAETGGGLKTTLDVPDQSAAGVPVDSVTLEGDNATISVKRIRGEFKGVRGKDGNSIKGQWKQGPLSLPLELKKVETASTRKRPQMPNPPFPYRVEEVSYPSVASGVKLAGTLTIPEGKGPFPAVVFASGSGPQDRDETLLGHKPFLVLDDALTRRGVAVLRADDRGVGKSTGNQATATTADFADDAQGGLDFLKHRSEIDARRIGMLGHSEGGVIIPMVAARAPSDVAFLVLMAGTGMTGERILIQQNADMLRAAGAGEDAIALNQTILREVLAILRPSTEPKSMADRIRAVVKANLAKLPAADLAEIGETDVAGSLISRLETPWMRFFLAHDPLLVLKQVKCPVLAINGERDRQVACAENLEGIARALKEGGNVHVTTRAFPKLNHLFQICETGALSEYVRIEETIAPEVLKAIADWVVEQPPLP
jgi:pimeloyl-ACP methyl ester carboxylesterase